MTDVATTVGKLYVEEHGSGPGVVLWHSLLCDGRMWREQVPALAARYRVIVIDGPGHGRSERVRRPYTMDDCVMAALDILDAVGLQRAAWVGLSWGGMIGMRLGIRHPERVRALGLLDTSARRDQPAKLVGYRGLEVLNRVLGPARFISYRLAPIMFSDETIRKRPELVDEFVVRLATMDQPAMRTAIEAVIFGRSDVSAELDRISVPTLVLCGEQDRATAPAESRLLAERIPGAELAFIPGAGHLSALERPEVVTEALLAFLARALA